MCCFSGRVDRVENTRIFARRVDAQTQALAYAMRVSADDDVAMVLPLPTDPAAGEDAVRFVDLSGASELFYALDALYPSREDRLAPQALRGGRTTLAVHTVGAFEASFVPSADDFARLDARFRLAPSIAEALCARERFGFAVFQLRGLAPTPAAPRPWWRRVLSRAPVAPTPRGQAFHPMALTFRTRTPGALFLPTVHVHDGTLPATARFDHTLYVQGGADASWSESARPPHEDLVRRAKGILTGEAVVWRRALQGELPNRDVIVSA
ncbi:MAG: hypothetical protein U0325_19120 [Polyangiales bacterium]